MNSNKFILAFDTSNYTTSVALCDMEGNIVENLKLPLPVGKGQRGLRQSEALFHHVNRLPDLLKQLKFSGKIVAVGYSSAPRECEGSYMPCFLAGRMAANSVAAANSIPVYEFSHQNGHIMAAMYSADKTDLVGSDFYAFHVSGGTTEVLKVTGSDDKFISSSVIGGTLDLNAGQVIDRIGVLMGLSFPAGRAMEALALEYCGKIDPFTPSVKGIECNLSGLENKASQLFENTNDKNRVAAFVLESVKKTLNKITVNLFDEFGKLPVIYAGGVMSCSVIRNALSQYGSFSDPAFSCDNAAGCALLTRLAFLRDKENRVEF